MRWSSFSRSRRAPGEPPWRVRQLGAQSNSRGSFFASSAESHSRETVRAELRRRIEINRSEWLSNAQRSPLALYQGHGVNGGYISGYAAIAGLAAIIFLAANLQSPEASSEKSSASSAPGLQVTQFSIVKTAPPE